MDRNLMLIARAQDGDSSAADSLCRENLRLVQSIAARFAGRGTELCDLVQIGSVGLVKAISGFDLSRGLKFSTYAVPMITGEIKRFLRDDGIIHVSRGLKERRRAGTVRRGGIAALTCARADRVRGCCGMRTDGRGAYGGI